MQSMVGQNSDVNKIVTLLQICQKNTLYNPNVDLVKDNVLHI